MIKCQDRCEEEENIITIIVAEENIVGIRLRSIASEKPITSLQEKDMAIVVIGNNSMKHNSILEKNIV